jgi:hypothetical protein
MLTKEEIEQRLNRTIEEINDLENDKDNEFQNYFMSTLNLRLAAQIYAEILMKQYSISENKLLKVSE